MRNKPNKNRWLSGGRWLLSLLALMLFATGIAQAAEVTKTFKVAPLNVDGLPQSILGITLNGDGPGASGTTKIGQYMASSGVDVWGLSEDFNYHSNLLSGLGDGYNVGTYRGGLSTNGLDWSNIKFDTDGLEFISKYAFVNESWAAWNQTYGKFTNGADELISKGYRYYTINFGDGVLVDFYIMHMDAETDAEDNAARASQWEQLAAAIAGNSNGHPKIVMGDTNSRYTRDDIQNLFFATLSADYSISDVWVEKCKGGVYPKLGDEALLVSELGYKEGEIVDKVIYLNPKSGAGMQLTANSIKFDTEDYTDEDGLLGDHPPVIVEFTATGEALAPTEAADWWVGETRTNATQQMYLYNVGSKYFMTYQDATNNQAFITNISQANIWTLSYSNKGTTVFYSDNGTEYRVRLRQWWLGITGTRTGVYKATDHATNMTMEASTTTSGAYKFKNDSRYLNVAVDEQAAYTPAQTASVYNDWLLISQEQKDAYEKYNSLYNEANGLYADEDVDGVCPEGLREELAQVLEETKTSNYTRSADDIKKLEDIIAKYENRYYEVKVTAAKWATTCLPNPTEIPEGVKVYYATEFNKSGRYVHAEEFEGSVMPANVGFLVYSDTPATYDFHITTNNTSVSAPEGNILSGTTKAIDGKFTENNDVYMLANKTAGVGFYHVKQGVSIAARRAYLVDIDDSEQPSSTTRMSISLTDDGTTGIDGISILTDGAPTAIFDLSGRRHSALQRGVNIVKYSNGTVRKVVVK